MITCSFHTTIIVLRENGEGIPYLVRYRIYEAFELLPPLVIFLNGWVRAEDGTLVPMQPGPNRQLFIERIILSKEIRRLADAERSDVVVRHDSASDCRGDAGV